MARASSGMGIVSDFDEVVDLATAGPAVYVRFSEGPTADAGGTSRDAEANVAMPGLSVSMLTPEPWWTKPSEEWVARRLCTYLDLQAPRQGRHGWLLYGVECGRGTDHEPLVRDVQPIGWLGGRVIERAQQIYEDRFFDAPGGDGQRESG
jgi:hypothetical protein